MYPDAKVYLINLILALPIFLICRVVWRQLEKDRRVRLIMTLISTLILTPLTYIGIILISFFAVSYHPKEEFSREKWFAEEETRYELTDDLIDRELLIGKTKKEVVELLGNTDTTTQQMRYYIGFEPGFISLDPSMLCINFEDGRVVDIWVR